MAEIVTSSLAACPAVAAIAVAKKLPNSRLIVMTASRRHGLNTHCLKLRAARSNRVLRRVLCTSIPSVSFE